MNRTKRYIGRLARRSITAGMAAGLVAGLVAAGPGVVSSQAASVAGLGAGNGAGATADPASYVNPLIGTGSGGDVVGQVDTFPGASAPFGMLTFSPDTAPTGADGGGYYSGDSQIKGFSLTHISGPGCGAFGDFPILPTAGTVPDNPYTTTDSFSHTGEQASPGYYSVSLGSPAIQAQLTATTRSGLANFTFPGGSQGNVLFKVDGSQNGDVNQSVQFVGNDEVAGTLKSGEWPGKGTGHGKGKGPGRPSGGSGGSGGGQATSGHFCGSPDTYPVYFAARFSRPFSSEGTWQQTATGSNVFGTSQTGTLPWGGPDNNGCTTNTGSLTSVNGGAGESWTASCVTPQTWAQVTPKGLTSGDTYLASVTLEANSTKQTAPVYLDFYNGCVDTSSQEVTLTPGKPVTLTDSTTVGCSNTPQFQVRTSGAGGVDLTATNASIQQVTEKPDPGATSASGSGAAAYASFAPPSGSTAPQTVQMQVAISYVSTADAWANLQAEQGSSSRVPPGKRFASIERATRASWNRLLSKIQVSGGSAADLTKFYTALYHALLDPSVFSDDNGRYLGFDGAVHQLPRGQQVQYANYSGWDVYRSEIQLLSLVAPSQTGDMMQSLVKDAAQGGWLPKWPLADDYTNVMNGDAADAMIADAYAFGVRNFNVPEALSEMVKGASVVPAASQEGHGWYVERPQLSDYLKLGYTPNVEQTSLSPVDNGASQTLEYALDDFGIAQLAQALGQRSTAAEFAKRAQNWENLDNPANGYLQPRDGAGDFPAGDPLTVGYGSFGQSGFQEGNAAQYNFAAPQNLGALINLMGGRATAISRLNTFFTQLNAGPNEPYYWAGNEIDLNAPWVYDYAGEPYQTQGLVRNITNTLYSASAGGEPGNDDLGAMSSWLVFADLGLYPETAGAPVLVTGSPLFSQAVVHLPSGRALEISGAGAGDDQPYVTGLAVDGRPTQQTWVSASDLLARGGSLAFTLSSTPDRSWGSAPADAPPSYTEGQAPVVVAPAGAVEVAPGGTATADLTAANATAQSQTVSWSVSAPSGSGLSATPSHGTASVPAGGGTIPVTLSASSSAPETFSTVTVSATVGGQAVPAENLTVQVATPGSLASYFGNRGVSDDSDPMAADFDGGGYSYSAQALAAAGASPGGKVSAGGASYVWPSSPAGEPDNVVANGQVVTVNAPAGASSLDLLASATDGASSGTVTVTYSDGSTASVPITVTDWAAGSPEPGNTVALATPYRNCGCGSTVYGTTSVYSVAVPINSALGVAKVTLPADTSGGAMHIFAVTTS
ncbi:MAG TPA: GH92 family glycosyl hydrolase, partial [Streptosporangiaceae bacterium]|nr:GH92 family glycosyl hydrolase [Streptosporangiaceae bacterium]